METAVFNGQQADERILYTVSPPAIVQKLAYASLGTLFLVFVGIIFLLATAVPVAAVAIQGIGIPLCMVFLLVGLWFTSSSFAKDRTYITDRRIIRFETVSPLFQTKRALFWSEALKAKAYAPGIFYRLWNIGTVHVEPTMGEGESVRVGNVAYYEDLANYIDKILYTVKNTPDRMGDIKPFIAKPKGKRGT